MSNELEVTLPLDTEHITLPPYETRLDDEDLYKEYVEVREAGGRSPLTNSTPSPSTHVSVLSPQHSPGEVASQHHTMSFWLVLSQSTGSAEGASLPSMSFPPTLTVHTHIFALTQYVS